MSPKQHIIDLETKFWDTMISKDAETASSLLTKKSIIVGPQGVSEIARGDFAKMMDGSKWTLESYKLSDVHVLFPTDDTAIIGYKVRQKGMMDGKPYDMQCADSSAWTKTDGGWQCALHTETVMDDS